MSAHLCTIKSSQNKKLYLYSATNYTSLKTANELSEHCILSCTLSFRLIYSSSWPAIKVEQLRNTTDVIVSRSLYPWGTDPTLSGCFNYSDIQTLLCHCGSKHERPDYGYCAINLIEHIWSAGARLRLNRCRHSAIDVDCGETAVKVCKVNTTNRHHAAATIATRHFWGIISINLKKRGATARPWGTPNETAFEWSCKWKCDHIANTAADSHNVSFYYHIGALSIDKILEKAREISLCRSLLLYHTTLPKHTQEKTENFTVFLNITYVINIQAEYQQKIKLTV